MAMPRNPHPNPYVGPRSFEPGEHLYGRDTETRKLANLLGAERVVLLHSPSGAGKTSLVQAALIPRMRERKFHIRPVARVNHEAAQPLSNGYNRYVFSVLSSLESAWPDDEQIADQELAGLTLPAYLARRPKPDGVSFELFIFDQFEEVLTLDPTDQAAKHGFFAQLGDLLEDRTRWALFSMREDFLGALAPYLIPIPNRLSATFRLDLLGEDAARQALQRPVRAAGAEFDDAAAQMLVDDLRRVQVQRPDGTLEVQLGPHVEPVQLQVVGYRLWDSLADDDAHIDQGDLAALGDVGDALADYYAGRVATIAQDSGVSERAIREWCDRKLITEQGIRGQVLMGKQRSEGLENSAVRLLENAHLVRAEKRGGATWYELAHDRLIEPVRSNNAAWFAEHLSLLQRQARLWEDEHHSDGLLLRGKELIDAEAWVATHTDEVTETEREFLEDSRSARTARQAQARANRRVRSALIASILIALVAVVFMVAAVIFGVQAYQNNQMAQARLLAAASARRLNDGDKRLATLLAFQALQHYPYTVEAEGALGNIVRPQQQLSSFNTRFGSVLAAAFDRQGSQITTISDDGSLRRWNPANGRLLSTITGTVPISWAFFSDHATRIVTGSGDNTLRAWDAPSGRLVATISWQLDEVNSVTAFSPDGTRIATARHLEQTVRVLDMANGQLLVTLSGHTGSINSIAFSPDGARIITASDDQTARLWDATSGQVLTTLNGHTNKVTNVAFSPDGARAITTSDDQTARVWDVASGKLISTLSGYTGKVNSAAFSLDGRRIVTVRNLDQTYQTHTADVWDAASGKLISTLSGYTGRIDDIAFSPNGARIVTTSYVDQTARLWDAASGEQLAILGGHMDRVNTAVFSPDGAWILTTSRDGTARVWDARGIAVSTLPIPAEVKGHTGALNSVNTSADGTRLVTAGSDGTARVWDAATGKLLVTLSGHTSSVYNAVLSVDGARVVTTSADNTARVWDAATGKLLATLSGHTSRVTGAAFNPGGTRVVTTSDDQTAREWDAASGKLLATLSGHIASVNRAEFSPDGARIVTAGADGTARLWDAANGKLIATLSGHTSDVRSGVFSSDGARIVTASADHSARVWDAASRKLIVTLNGHTDTVTRAAFSSDGARIVTASADKSARVWDAASGKLIATLSGHTGVVFNAAFSPDGTRIVTEGADGTARIWDVDHGQELFLIAGSASEVRVAAFDKDGTYLLVGHTDGLLQRWQLWPSRQALLDYARNTCGTCEPTYQQRIVFPIYNWPMLAFEYRQILIAFWLSLLYILGGWVVYRGVFVRSAGAVPDSDVGFTWKRFAAAGAQGGLLVMLALTGIFTIWLIEILYFGQEAARVWRVDSESEMLIPLLFVLPLGLLAGGAYSHYTRTHQPRQAWRKRILLAGLAGLAGNFFLILVASAIGFLWLIQVIPLGQPPTLAEWLTPVFLISLIVGVAGGIMSIIGAALYIFALQPLATRWLARSEEEE